MLLLNRGKEHVLILGSYNLQWKKGQWLGFYLNAQTPVNCLISYFLAALSIFFKTKSLWNNFLISEGKVFRFLLLFSSIQYVDSMSLFVPDL